MPQKYGYLANTAEGALTAVACLVCDDSQPIYSWTDYSGEGYCVRCGTSYQLKWGKLEPGETYPRCNVKESWIPTLRAYWKETGLLNGCGTYLGFDDYPDQLAGRRALIAWLKIHPDMVPTND